ncbi:50S ribosomal protein L4 [Psychroflexus maritimus]|uniref:Large ribosomal subunit protein uL4 n=1 Tax=Psychroflexus maritimus TaxID=2714865 RepID=A0A967AEN6_9FLAO|nr:50S ribosomal protein L4 [Psychroflexus maritimus]NGZ90340.1 50S ribosomal protein L4 [Psychroflexus maritimus]
MKLAVLDINGKETGKEVTLSDAVFGIEPNEHAIYLDVKQHLANKRQGTHKAKERAEIKGSTRKIKKQKGTGTARAGSIKSPVFRGGGRIFGPRPRDYHFKLNKKLKRLARKSALAQKAKANQIIILDNLTIEQPKTKEFKQVLSNLGVADKKSVFVLDVSNKNVYLSSRNLEESRVVTASGLNTYNILNNGVLVLSEAALTSLESNLTK